MGWWGGKLLFYNRLQNWWVGENLRVLKRLQRPDGHDLFVEFFVGEDGLVAEAGFVGVDGCDGIVEDTGDLFVIVDAHADEGEDSQLGVEQLALLY